MNGLENKYIIKNNKPTTITIGGIPPVPVRLGLPVVRSVCCYPGGNFPR